MITKLVNLFSLYQSYSCSNGMKQNSELIRLICIPVHHSHPNTLDGAVYICVYSPIFKIQSHPRYSYTPELS